jgi:hypothetical protein
MNIVFADGIKIESKPDDDVDEASKEYGGFSNGVWIKKRCIF